jgi:hypothetical protein
MAKRLPIAQQRVIERMVRLICDYVVDTFRWSPIDTSRSLPRDREGLLARGRPDRDGEEGSKVFSLVLWADEKHTCREIVKQLCTATGWNEERSREAVAVLEKEVWTLSLVLDFCVCGGSY